MLFWLAAAAISGPAAQAQSDFLIGEWRSYLSHVKVFRTTEGAGMVYGVTSGGMISYSPESKEVRIFSTVDGLSGVNPTALYYAEGDGRFFVGYSDGSIDYFSDPSDIGYLTDIRIENLPDKGINAFASDESRLFVATNFGMVIFNLAKNEVQTDVLRFADNPSRLSVQAVTVGQDRIWVVLEDAGLYSAPLSASDLRNPLVWQAENGNSGLPQGLDIRDVVAGDGRLCLRETGGVWERKNGLWEEVSALKEPWARIRVNGTRIAAARFDQVTTLGNDGNVNTFYINGFIEDLTLTPSGGVYIGTTGTGMIEYKSGVVTPLKTTGPPNNDCVRIAVGNGQLFVAPRGYDQIYTPDPSRLGVFYFSQTSGDWTQLSSENGRLPGEVATGFARAYFDPQGGIAYMGSWGEGIVALGADAAIEAFYTCQNSGLSVVNDPCNEASYDNTRVSGMDMDPFGNLWVSTDFGKDPLSVRKADGTWLKISGFRFPTGHHIVDLMADDYGNIWMINNDQGLLVYTSNGTSDDLEDGRVIALRTGANLGNLPSGQVYSLAKDSDGFIWVGTGRGVTVYYDPYTLSTGKLVDASAPVFNRTDLLKNTVVKSIAVDGGNRKWIGTNAGVFLVSESGDEQYYQFTTDNSPLPDNNVNDLKIDPQTGEVFFATDLGLVSFLGDATKGADNCSEVFVYPNPVFTDYEGPVVIRGTTAGSKVKISTLSGMLVQEIESQGGTAVWNGLDVYGQEVRSGIYLALISDDNGNNACIGKFTVIRR